jgi:hypothetical protein
MSADLVIGVLSATVHSEADDAARRTGVTLERLARGGLEAALRSASLPAGRWYVRHHVVAVQEDLAKPGSTVAAMWAEQLVASLARRLRAGGEGVVRYASEIEIPIDAVSEIARGRLGREWAWRQAGVLPESCDPSGSPGAAILRVLRSHPETAARVLAAAATRATLACLDRALGQLGWHEAAEIAAGGPLPEAIEQAGASAGRALAAELIRGSTLAALICRTPVRPAPGTVRAWSVLASAEVDPLAARRSAVVAAVEAELTRILAVEVLQPPVRRNEAQGPESSEPSIGPSPVSDSVGMVGRSPDAAVETVEAQRTAPAGSGPLPERLNEDRSPGRADRSPRQADADKQVASPNATSEGLGRDDWPVQTTDPAFSAVTTEREASDGAGMSSSEALADAGPTPLDRQAPERGSSDDAIRAADSNLEDSDAPEPTQFGGLLFVLSTATEAGLPQRATRSRLAGRPLPWVVHQAVQRMVDVPPDEPAALAIAGTNRIRGQWLLEAEPATKREDQVLKSLAANWTAATLGRLAAARDDDQTPVPELAWLVQRPATVLALPGWVEITFRARDADSLVRRAGLDLDPGWVDWLGCVVRYRYE